MTSPQTTLSNVAGTTQTYEYKYRSSDVNYYYYDRWVTSTQQWANQNMIWGSYYKSNAIKVGKTQGHSDYQTWFDVETASTNYMLPHTVSANGANIELKDTNSNVFYAFVNPYYQAPSNNTLNVVPTEFTTSVPSGVTPFDDAGPELYLTIAKTEASGQYNIYMDDVYYATVTHTNGFVSSSQVAGRSFALNAKLYFGQVFISSSLNTLVTEFTWPTRKKVHANFW